LKTYCLEVTGDFACFTRPEMKVERVSYDVITPSAARAVFEAILWKPAIRWHIRKIEVLKPVRWISLRRNEVGAVVPMGSVKSAMNKGSGDLALYVEDERQQRAGLFLRDVAYRLHADMELLAVHPTHRNNYPHLVGKPVSSEEIDIEKAPNTLPKFMNMFERRATKGQCINQPYLGCREFACGFRWVTDVEREPMPIDETRDLGWMLHDMNFDNATEPTPRFFRAELKAGVLCVPDAESAEVRG
jgi:CRISPR-associated protein Cas5d